MSSCMRASMASPISTTLPPATVEIPRPIAGFTNSLVQAVAIVVVVFAINNRGAAEVNLWPFDMIVAWPLFVFVFIGAGIGFLVGATVMWLSSAPARRKSRERAGRVRQLERDAARNTSPESPEAPRAIAPRTPARTG